VNDILHLHLNNQMEKNRNLKDLRESAAHKIVENQIANEKSYDRTHKKATAFKVNDYVMIANVDATAGINKKLIPKYKRSYIIRKVLDSDRYVISDIPGFQITQMPYTSIASADCMRF